MAKRSGKVGCWAVVCILLFIGLVGVGLQKIGCMSSEEGLRSGTTVAVTGKEVIEPKNIFVVKYTVSNDTKWPARLSLEWTVHKTTGTTIATNSVALDRVPPKQASEQRVMFDLAELKNAGIKDPMDGDVCTVECKIVSIMDADSPPGR
jgi:hypothetical protein